MNTITLDSRAMQAVSGSLDETFRLIEKRFDVRLAARGEDVTVVPEGEANAEERARVATELLRQLILLHERGVTLRRAELKSAIALVQADPTIDLVAHFIESRIPIPGKRDIVPKTVNQRRYIDAIRDNDLVFGIGPAGTGKSYLAVAMAVSMLLQKKVRRIILARPAVEAGENLGFLPGDLAAKVDPYLRPLYDALYDMLEHGTIEVAPLAFMRGRTLDHAFLILDEAQNTTSEQMKMFLTRIGFYSKAVVTGDVTQIDLPSRKISGLVEASDVVQGVDGTDFIEFDQADVVRHPLVQRIIVAYDQRDQARSAEEDPA